MLYMSKFVKRQTKASRFSHWDIPDMDLLCRVAENWCFRKEGYRDGVVLVPVDPKGFFTSTVTLKPGDKLRGGYEPRVPGEEPRKFVCLDSGGITKPPAVAVDVVMYRKDVLDEDGDWDPIGDPRVPFIGDWAVISVNCHPTDESNVPIEPETLIANHFHLDGGTNTGMDNDQFVDALRVSVLYWRNKTVLG